MKGRIAGLKKTWVLRGIALFCFLAFVALACLSFLIFKIPNLWFFSFCACIGIYELARGFLFHYDSAIYLGFLLANIGANGFFIYFLDMREYTALLISLAFALASLSTYFICHQRFHLILSYSIIFLTLYGFLLAKNLITTPIFIAFVSTFLIQLMVSIIIYFRKGN